MAVAIRVLLLAALVALSGCYKTELPSYSYSKPGYSKQVNKHRKTYATHTVRRGDTLYSIGKRFGVDHKLLARRNHIRYPYTIYVGQRLSLTRVAPKPQYMPIPKARTKTKFFAKKRSIKPAAKKMSR